MEQETTFVEGNPWEGSGFWKCWKSWTYLRVEFGIAVGALEVAALGGHVRLVVPLMDLKLLLLQVQLGASLHLADVFGLHLLHHRHDVLVLVDVEAVEFEGLDVGARTLLAHVHRALVNRHKGTGFKLEVQVVPKKVLVKKFALRLELKSHHRQK